MYADQFRGLNWSAVDFSSVSSWTFPPPSIHEEATPEIIRAWYDEQWHVDDYRNFVMGWLDDDSVVHRPILYGLIDDHDYGMNNGDATYQYQNESNVAFVDFLYRGVADDRECLLEDDASVGQRKECASGQDYIDDSSRSDDKETGRQKSNDPMYRRSLEGKGVYGVQLFDFSRTKKPFQGTKNKRVIWGEGYWVPDEDARIDPAFIRNGESHFPPTYSTTHSVAIFALDLRSNKTPWPRGKQKRGSTGDNGIVSMTSNNSSGVETPAYDFLGKNQWEWLRSALNNSRATVNIIISGLQIHPERFPNDGNVVEEWSKFPEARQLLYDTILNSGARSPIFVSGDVHMAQIMRKDCVRSSDINEEQLNKGINDLPQTRPLVEITTSGMTHSWGTSFRSQIKNHRWPLKPYSYFISRTFMTIAHAAVPMFDLVIKTLDFTKDGDNPKATVGGGSLGLQYYLGLNFAEFEFDFDNDVQNNISDSDGGAFTVRIFGTKVDGPPKLEMRYKFDELNGRTDLPGMTARMPQDFLIVRRENSNVVNESQTRMDGWICVPHRGLASIYHQYAAMIVMITTFCILFFLPHGAFILIIIYAWRRWSRKENVVHVNGYSHVNKSSKSTPTVKEVNGFG